MDFPFYAMREYTSLSTEGKYIVVQGHKTKYVLDDTELAISYPLYEDRRLILATKRLPHKLYPLNKRIETLDALIDSEKTLFINKYGRLVRWNKKVFTKVITARITTTLQTDKGHWRLWIDELEHPFHVISYNNEKYLQYVRINNLPTLYSLLEERRKDTRIKI